MVQVPAGSPVSSILPVAVEHVGCVTVPMVGADGVGGCALMVAEADATEVQPEALVTVKL
ncbi:MAG: hypothetical protein U0X58_12560 [Flavobacteriaceae bacterium]